MKPLISFIIPNFNDSRIENTLNSIFNQTFSNYEIIVVEGCIDNNKTESIYKKHENRINKLIVEKDNGIFDALNKGIKVAAGEYILLIGADDRLGDNNILKDLDSLLKLNKDIHGVCIECHFVNKNNKIIRKWIPGKISNQKIRWGILPPHFSLFLNREIYDKYGLFDISKGTLGLDSIWLLHLSKINNLNIPVMKNHAVIMEIGGTSTGSIKNILNGNIKLAKEARTLRIKQWFLLPFIKMSSKIIQFR